MIAISLSGLMQDTKKDRLAIDRHARAAENVGMTDRKYLILGPALQDLRVLPR
jgi:hypothetical protein